MVYRLYTDGAVLNNPGGKASIGFVLYGDNELIGKCWGLVENECPYDSASVEGFAISRGLSFFINRWNQPGSLYVYNDSQYVIGQIKKRRPKDKLFQVIDFQVSIIEKYIPVSFQWIPRSENEADSLSKYFR